MVVVYSLNTDVIVYERENLEIVTFHLAIGQYFPPFYISRSRCCIMIKKKKILTIFQVLLNKVSISIAF